MKTAGRENPKRWATTSQQPSPWRGRSEQLSFVQMGCEARKLAATGEIFFLDFSFYRTLQELTKVFSGFVSTYCNFAYSDLAAMRIGPYLRDEKELYSGGIVSFVGEGCVAWLPSIGPSTGRPNGPTVADC